MRRDFSISQRLFCIDVIRSKWLIRIDWYPKTPDRKNSNSIIITVLVDGLVPLSVRNRHRNNQVWIHVDTRPALEGLRIFCWKNRPTLSIPDSANEICQLDVFIFIYRWRALQYGAQRRVAARTLNTQYTHYQFWKSRYQWLYLSNRVWLKALPGNDTLQGKI